MSDQKIIVPFDGKNESEIDTGGIFTQIGFERLKTYLEPICDIDEDESITGLIITKDLIKIRIDRITPVINR